jgi:hypothetical protein
MKKNTIYSKSDLQLDHEIRELNGKIFDVEWDMSNTYDEMPEKKLMRKDRRNLIEKLYRRVQEQLDRRNIYRGEEFLSRRISL